MTNIHIENLNIENFKCFKKLDMKNIQRVNLIGGKNNVGKTALLEAIEMVSYDRLPSEVLAVLHNILERRQEEGGLELNVFNNPQNKILIFSNINVWELELFEISKTEIGIEERAKFEISSFPFRGLKSMFNGLKASLPLDDFLSIGKGRIFKDFNKNLNFIPASKNNTAAIAILFGSLIEWDREDFLNQSLSLFDENILSFKQILSENGVTLKLKLKDRQELVLLSSMGEGVSRYIAILCAIWASKDGVLLIDEIENGIHYSNYPKLWKIIFQASKDANCQVFATSHSKECIEAFNEAQRAYGDGMYFELYKNLKTDMIDISGRETEQLEYALTHGGKIRGE